MQGPNYSEVKFKDYVYHIKVLFNNIIIRIQYQVKKFLIQCIKYREIKHHLVERFIFLKLSWTFLQYVIYVYKLFMYSKFILVSHQLLVSPTVGIAISYFLKGGNRKFLFGFLWNYREIREDKE